MAVLETKHLRLIKTVADEGNLTLAAARLHLTQPALSHQLKALEDRFQIELLQRVGRRMVLTDAGRMLFEASQAVLQILQEAEDELARRASGISGSIRVGAECYTTYHWLPEVARSFQQRFSNVDIELVPNVTRRPFDALLRGEIDVALVSQAADSELIETVSLFDCEDVLVTAPTHPLAGKPYAGPEDFLAEHVVLHHHEDSLFLHTYMKPAGIVPRRTTGIPITECVLEVVRAGLAVTAMTRWAAAPLLESGDLVAIPLGPEGRWRRWSAAYLPGNLRDEPLTEFIQHLRLTMPEAIHPGRKAADAPLS